MIFNYKNSYGFIFVILFLVVPLFAMNKKKLVKFDLYKKKYFKQSSQFSKKKYSNSEIADHFISNISLMRWSDFNRLSNDVNQKVLEKIKGNPLLEKVFEFAAFPHDIQNTILDNLFNQDQEAKNIFLQGTVKQTFDFLALCTFMDYKETYQFGNDDAFYGIDYNERVPLLVLKRSAMFQLSACQIGSLQCITNQQRLNRQQLNSLLLLPDNIKNTLKERGRYHYIIYYKYRNNYYKHFISEFIEPILKMTACDFLMQYYAIRMSNLMKSKCTLIEPESNIVAREVIKCLKLSSNEQVANFPIPIEAPYYSPLDYFFYSMPLLGSLMGCLFSSIYYTNNYQITYFVGNKTCKFFLFMSPLIINFLLFFAKEVSIEMPFVALLLQIPLLIKVFYNLKEHEWSIRKISICELPSFLKRWDIEIKDTKCKGL